MAPPVPPDGTAHEFVAGEPIGAGFRVPCVIVSPWTSGGWVCSELFDHTSSLRFLESLTGVAEPNISDWRRKTFGDFTAAFRFEESVPRAPSLPSTGADLSRALYEADNLPPPVLPGQDQKLPEQEKGSRSRVPRGGAADV